MTIRREKHSAGLTADKKIIESGNRIWERENRKENG